MSDGLTNAALAILSLVVEQPRHGYELEAVIKARGMREWTDVGFSSIYYLLKKLQAQGLVETRPSAKSGGRGPGRKVFAASEAGRRACREAVLRALSVPDPPRSSLQLGLANLPLLGGDEVRAALGDRRAALDAASARLKGVRASQAPLPSFVDAMFDHSLALIEAEQAWLERFMTTGATMSEATPEKIDFRKVLKPLYAPPKGEWTEIEVPERRFLMVDGEGVPAVAQAYHEAVEALYALSYKLKFHSKTQLGRDYTVPPLEGLWWAEDMSTFVTRDKAAWQWTLMIPVPDWLGAADIQAMREVVKKKKDPAALALVRFEAFTEGRCLQRLHVGSYDDETEPLRQLHEEVMPARGLTFNGKHHEIYLSDPRRVAPEKLRTVLRQPVRPV